LFDNRHAKLIVVRIREEGDFIERDGGVKRPPNTLPKMNSNACPFLSRIARLWAMIMLVHHPHILGSQHWRG
jgi:hypothetical protein